MCAFPLLASERVVHVLAEDWVPLVQKSVLSISGQQLQVQGQPFMLCAFSGRTPATFAMLGTREGAGGVGGFGGGAEGRELRACPTLPGHLMGWIVRLQLFG